MIRISQRLAREIRRAAERDYPVECCGVLLGTEAEGEKFVAALHATRNAHARGRERRYLIAPEELLEAERAARGRGMDVIGYYHSHPDAAASPSDTDRAHAWPWASYLIVSVTRGRARAMTAWVFYDPDAPFTREPISIGR